MPNPVLQTTSATCANWAASDRSNGDPTVSLSASDNPNAPAPLVPNPHPIGIRLRCAMSIDQVSRASSMYFPATNVETDPCGRGLLLKVARMRRFRVFRTFTCVVTPRDSDTAAPVDPTLTGSTGSSWIRKKPVTLHGEKAETDLKD